MRELKLEACCLELVSGVLDGDALFGVLDSVALLYCLWMPEDNPRRTTGRTGRRDSP
jgi:hypothetical protein